MLLSNVGQCSQHTSIRASTTKFLLRHYSSVALYIEMLTIYGHNYINDLATLINIIMEFICKNSTV